MTRFAGFWGIFSSFEDSLLTPDGLSFQWMETGKRSARSGVELLGRNIPTLHFKTERVADTALREG